MIRFNIEKATSKNAGDAREWGAAAHYGVSRSKHDSVSYDKGSDIEAGALNVSVKSSGATLMSGNLCEGREDFDGIWELYESRTHSNRFLYVTVDMVGYEMSLSEFKAFIYAFGRTERESSKNGGAMKIRLRKESSKMLRWLEERAA